MAVSSLELEDHCETTFIYRPGHSNGHKGQNFLPRLFGQFQGFFGISGQLSQGQINPVILGNMQEMIDQ